MSGCMNLTVSGFTPCAIAVALAMANTLQSTIRCHKINSHSINSHEVNSRVLNSHEINLSQDQFPHDQLNFYRTPRVVLP